MIYTIQRKGVCPVAKDKDKDTSKGKLVGFLGVGLDNQDGEHRITRSEHFFLIGGSESTHERMQDTAIRFSESLRRKGKQLHETTVEEVVDLLHDAQE